MLSSKSGSCGVATVDQMSIGMSVSESEWSEFADKGLTNTKYGLTI